MYLLRTGSWLVCDAMTGNDKRQRHKDGHRNRVQEAREAESRARRNRTVLVIAGIIAFLVVAIAVVSLVGGDGKEKVAAGPTGTEAGTDGTGTTVAAAPGGDPLPCPAEDGRSKPVKQFPAAPPVCINEAKTYRAVVSTSEGDITIDLDPKQSPTSVNNFVYLSRYHFYDGIGFHRIVTGFVDQTGDPDGTGTGGPGYDLPDEDPAFPYEAGDVAMARGATVSGSQFFFTLDPKPLNGTRDAGQPAYPLLGKVSKGQEVVKKINSFGAATGEGTPTKRVTIETITIQES